MREAKEDALQAKLVAEQRGREADAPYSSGRGGAGNISRSKSRGREEVATELGPPIGQHGKGHVHAGRGGWGNISETRDSESVDEAKASLPFWMLTWN